MSDHADQTRRPKTSAHWYGQVARTGAVPQPGPEFAWKTESDE